MTTSVLEVVRAGPFVTVQDGGRPGMMRFGVPRSGPMDPFAHAAANTVLGRPVGSTAVEVSLGGLTVRCADAPITIAVCGGGFRVSHNGDDCNSWMSCTLQPGDTLAITAGGWGSWCYVAVAGALQARQWLGSSSTHVRSGLGGGAVATGDRLTVIDAQVDDARTGPIDTPASTRPTDVLRVVPGPQLQCFRPGALETLLGSPYTLSTAYDRMGVRLDGPALELDGSLAIPSSPIVRGSLQVAGDGVPTLLFADHQTTGGYPKIATVIAPDAASAAQLRSGQVVRFAAVTPEQAVAAARSAAADSTSQLAQVAARPGLRTRHLLSTNLVDGAYHPDETDPEETHPDETHPHE
jgi:allophanate hydrolase